MTNDSTPRADDEGDTAVIRWFDHDPGPCIECCGALGSGPVGFRLTETSGPLCDGCLLALNRDLGMLLIMGAASRQLAYDHTSHTDEGDQQMVALMVIATMYDRGARWPRRPLAALELVKRFDEKTSRLPLDMVRKVLDGNEH